MRDEVPHVKMPPSEYIREHFWVTTQPMEEAEDPEHLIDVMNWIGLDRIMFSSDYPHWDFDDPFAGAAAEPDRRAAAHDLCRQRARSSTGWHKGDLTPVLRAIRMARHVVAAGRRNSAGRPQAGRGDGRAIVVFNLGGEFFALNNRCPHRGGSLCHGATDRARAVRRARRIPLHRAAARSSAARGIPGSSTSAPGNPGAIRSKVKARRYGVSVEQGAKLVEGPYVAETFPVSVENEYVVVEA